MVLYNGMILISIKIGPRPVMPTAQICQKFENLQNSILTMFELKKVVDKTEVEHKVKVQKGRDNTANGRVHMTDTIFFIFDTYVFSLIEAIW